jgi:hypothetical protein
MKKRLGHVVLMLPFVVITLFTLMVALSSEPAEARLTRITAGPATLIDLPAFGDTGPYLKIAGTFEGELVPGDPRNTVIADIGLAPRTNGRVLYSSTFYILRPVNLGRGNYKIFYDFGNRGGKRILQWFNDGTASDDPSTAAHFGNGFLMRQGYTVAYSGWAGDVTPGPNVMSVNVPTATNPNGSSITGFVVAEATPGTSTATTINLPYTANSTSPSNGVLTVREHQTDPKVPVIGWSYVNDRRITFPGPAQVEWIYEFVYEAKDPTVMGIGHAATRDFLSFLRHAANDDFGNPNPLAQQPGQNPRVEAIYSWGRSQGGRVERDFLYYGFNEDEQGRIVIDGMMPYATGAGGKMWMNFRFSQPTVSAQQHSRRFSHEPEFPHTFPLLTDPFTGQRDGILRRCLTSKTCPKFFNIDSANEYWNKTSSLNHTDAMGNDLNIDALAPDVRIYSITSIEHNTVAGERPSDVGCQQLSNPLYNGPIFRALSVALDAWVTLGVEPPPSRVPRVRNGTLVPPEQIIFPNIPATHYAGWPSLPAVQFSPLTMNRNVLLDFSVVPPQPLGPEYATLVPQVDDDGNDIAGIRLPFLEAPLGTHTGWAMLSPGNGAPDICGQDGQFIPFANTQAERLAAGDPRLSIQERYPSHNAYVRVVTQAATRLVQRRFLLHEDKERIVEEAEMKGVGLWKTP